MSDTQPLTGSPDGSILGQPFIHDDSRIKADLFTRAEFGCALHEPKEG